MMRSRGLENDNPSIDKSKNDKLVTRKQFLVAFVAYFAFTAAAAQFGSLTAYLTGNESKTNRKAASKDSTQRGVSGNVKKARQRDSSEAVGNPDNFSFLPANVAKLANKTNDAAYIFDPKEDDYDESDLSKLNIRNWGCERRNEAPFIFVHLGKAGGGSVRARLAASATNYNRDKWTNYQKDTSYFYPMKEKKVIPRTGKAPDKSESSVSVAHSVQKGIFVNSRFTNFRPSYPKTNYNFTLDDMAEADKVWKTFEKTLPCSATTPLGQAIACPLARLGRGTTNSCRGRGCYIVYTGHNLLGNELHWLPTEYLARWWYRTPWAANGDVANLWQERAQRWHQPDAPGSSCQYTAKEKDPMAFYKTHYHDCVAPREDVIDQVANQKLLGDNDQQPIVDDWSPIYASMPVLRVTMMREPFSWLVSKFFWHEGMHGYMVGIDGKKKRLRSCDNNGTDYEDIAEWVSSAVLKQINHLCGEECLVRMNTGLMTLDQLERQARHNLQHSFAVVGLLHETQDFYDMITARAEYMDTSLNPEVTGARHSTSKREEYARCTETYQTAEFQEKLLAVCPELRALQRLYKVAVEVKRVQQQEMQTCGLLPKATSESQS